MKRFLFPRLRTGHAQLWARKFQYLTPNQVAAELPDSQWEGITYAATGGTRVDEEELNGVRARLVEVATDVGYPEVRSLEAQRRFDLALGHLLLELPIIRGEALRDEVWQYITCILLPDLVVWRYGKTRDTHIEGPTSRARFLGGDRNMVERIWWRTVILRDPNDSDELWLLDTGREGLTEDNMVALLERGNIASYHALCRTIAHEYVRNRPYVTDLAKSGEQLLIREVMKKVVRQAAHMNLDAIAEDARLEVISGLFVETVEEMGGEAPSRGRVYEGMTPIVLTPSDLPAPENQRPRIKGHRTGLQELLGTTRRDIPCRWKLYWPDGSIRAESESHLSWHMEPGSENGVGDWSLSYTVEECPVREANPLDILVLATRLEDGEFEAFLLPSQEKFSLQILGALESAEGGVRVPDEIEKLVRETLLKRL